MYTQILERPQCSLLAAAAQAWAWLCRPKHMGWWEQRLCWTTTALGARQANGMTPLGLSPLLWQVWPHRLNFFPQQEGAEPCGHG